MNLSFTLLALGIATFIAGLVIIPIIRKIAIHFNLVDKPNYRKLHTNPVPLVGGISIAFLLFLLLFLSGNFVIVFQKYMPLFLSAFVLLLVGVIDDKIDLSAKYKLVLQILLAVLMAFSGTRITSFYGFFGIYEIHIYLQYTLTIIVITGVVNAFNLMDGVDGLVGSFSFLGFTLFFLVSLFYKNIEMSVLTVVFMGSLLSFLRYNLSHQRKIFMGDSGSLFLGFTLITLGINILESKQNNLQSDYSYIFLLLVSFFTIPVLDSIRVYLARIKKGNSPFKADKSHIHHLLLSIGLTHKKISTYLVLVCAILFVVGLGLTLYFSTTLIVLIMMSLFWIMVKILLSINSLFEWKLKIKQIETNS